MAQADGKSAPSWEEARGARGGRISARAEVGEGLLRHEGGVEPLALSCSTDLKSAPRTDEDHHGLSLLWVAALGAPGPAGKRPANPRSPPQERELPHGECLFFFLAANAGARARPSQCGGLTGPDSSSEEHSEFYTSYKQKSKLQLQLFLSRSRISGHHKPILAHRRAVSGSVLSRKSCFFIPSRPFG